MEEKKSVKISLSTLFLILALIVIAFMALYIYTEKTNANKEIETLEANAVEMKNTIKDLQDKIDTISNTINSNNSNEDNNTTNTSDNNSTSFTDEQVKTALSNYLELRAHMHCNALLNNLTEKGALNYDQSKDIDTTVDGVAGYYITNIKYSDYRNAMLKYVSKSEFERNWNSYYSEDSNGNLLAGDGGGGLRVYTIKSITKTNDSTYSAKVTSVVEDGEYFEEENLTFVVTSNNGNCVIDSLK